MDGILDLLGRLKVAPLSAVGAMPGSGANAVVR
jgi:hypothetical protein